MVTSVTQSCPLKLNPSSQDPNVAPNPRCIFEMYRFTKSRWRTRPSIWILASILTHMTAQRHSAPQPSVCEVPKSPPSQNKQANEKRILHTKHTVHNKHVQWNRSHQVRTISLVYKSKYVLSELHIEHKWGIHILTDQFFGSLREST